MIADSKMKKSNYLISFLLLISFLSGLIDFSPRNNTADYNTFKVFSSDLNDKGSNTWCDNFPLEEASDESDKSESESKDDDMEKELKFFSNSEFRISILSSSLLAFADEKENLPNSYLEIPLMPPKILAI